MKSLLLLITTLLFTPLLFTHSIQADTYQYAVSVGHNDADSDGEEQQSNNIGGTFYFSPVDDSKGPLALASFIERASGISIGYRDSEIDRIQPMAQRFFTPLDPAGFIMLVNHRIDTEDLSIGGFYVFKESGWFVSAGLGELEGDGEFSAQKLAIDGDSYQLQIGKYIAATTTIGVSYSETERSNKVTSSFCGLPAGPLPFPGPCPFEDFTTKSDTEATSWRLSLNHLGESSNYHYTVNAALTNISNDATLVTSGLGSISRSSISSNDDWQYNTGGAIYPNNAVGLGLDYTLFDVRDIQTHVYEAHASWFITNSVSVSARFARSYGENSALDTDLYNILLSARF